MTAVWVALGGSLGAVCRFVLDGHIRAKFDHNFPWATIAINVSGSFVLGVMTGLLLKQPGLSSIGVVIGIGFCGGYTTFSAASFETVRLLEERRVTAAYLNAFGVLCLTLLCAGAGIVLGQLL
jgi:CrcB protein